MSITFKENQVRTLVELPKAETAAHDFKLMRRGLSEVSLKDYGTKKSAVKGTRLRILASFVVLLACCFALTHCTTSPGGDIPKTSETVQPGTHVSLGSTATTELYLGGFKVGEPLPASVLAGADMGPRQLNADGKVRLISIVPSLDTKVCEAQTHILGETTRLNPAIERVTISRDLPMAQQRFAAAAHLQSINYLSDYKDGNFGRSTGLLMKGPELLARAVIVTDHQGIVRYFQVVPDVTKLPDMDQAIDAANLLAGAQK